MAKYIFFDVGANNGSSSIIVAESSHDALVYAFEPIPEMISTIRSKSSHLPNYILTEVAVSDYTGKAIFNVSANDDWGCSSLLTLSDKAQTDWYGRIDMRVTHKIEVNVIRLEDFIRANGITRIDYLHIDTQGSDLNVLKGMGEYISIVEEGQMEAARIPDVLYNNQNSVYDSVDFLEANGFVITGIHGNDPVHNESNIWFRKKSEIYPASIPRPDWYNVDIEADNWRPWKKQNN